MQVGQKVYLEPIGDQSRISSEILECEVLKVGRKFIYINAGRREMKFHTDTLRQVTRYSPDWQIRFSLQEIEDEKEFNNLHSQLESAFRYGSRDKFTLDQLRQIKRIIDEPPKSEIKFPTEETVSVDTCICPYCGHEFNGQRAINNNLDVRIIDCSKCRKEMEVYPSVEYMCVAIDGGGEVE